VFTILDERTAKLLRRNLGTILTEEACAIRLREPEQTGGVLAPSALSDAWSAAPAFATLGEIDQVYADRLQPGDRFVLDGRCLELKKRADAALLVDEVYGRPAIPRWLGAGAPMPGKIAQRIFHFRVQASEMLKDGTGALRHWLEQDYHLGREAADELIRFLEEQETVSETPAPSALLIEAVASQGCSEFFVHTPLPRPANEALARMLQLRWTRAFHLDAMALAADLGIFVMVPSDDAVSLAAWYAAFSPAQFHEDWNEHWRTSELAPQSFARAAQVGLMVLRNPLGRKRKVGGRDWTERRLFDQIRAAAPDFVLLRQAEREAASAVCDVHLAREFAACVATMPIRVRHLAQPSPFGEALLSTANRGTR
jgi:ATP-dependent Lhr-like helicase